MFVPGLNLGPTTCMARALDALGLELALLPQPSRCRCSTSSLLLQHLPLFYLSFTYKLINYIRHVDPQEKARCRGGRRAPGTP